MNEQLMIEEALAEWKKINSDPRKWATFEAVRFSRDIRCAVKWGTIHANGSRETAIQTIVWTLYDSGRCDSVRVTHV